MNTQKPEPRIKGDGSYLDFHTMFFTLQGEGPFSGHRAIFVRLAGCNLQCPGCDTEYTLGRQKLHVSDILARIEDLRREEVGINARFPLIVITGGEPLRQNLDRLVEALNVRGYTIQIESNGVFAPSGKLDQLLEFSSRVKLVVSPKTKAINARTAELASAFKYVIDHRSVSPVDGLPILALEHPAAGGVARPPQYQTPPIYVNPYDAKDDAENQLNLNAAAASAMKYGYICGTQLHKLIGLE